MDQKSLGRNYTAVVLAAGFGSRISEMTDLPKCLLELNKNTLLERNFDIWKQLGIKKVNLVLGYKKELIQKVSDNYKNDFEFNFYLNEDYRNQGNTFSLYLGIREIHGPCLIFDADLVYEQEILAEFIRANEKSEILVGPGCLSDIECAKTLVDSKNFARMTVDKRAVSESELEKYKFAGEAIGILKFNKVDTEKLASKTYEFLSKKENVNLNWEHLLNNFLLNEEIGVHKFESGKWIEIDTSEDFKEAQALFEK